MEQFGFGTRRNRIDPTQGVSPLRTQSKECPSLCNLRLWIVPLRNATDIIISFAKDTYRSIFNREETKTIKSVMETVGKNKEDYRAIGTFLVFTADKKEDLSNSEYRKVSREVDDIAIGRYEQAQKRGNSMKL